MFIKVYKTKCCFSSCVSVILYLVRGAVAQRLEQRAHNLLVEGSIPSSPTKNTPFLVIGVFL